MSLSVKEQAWLENVADKTDFLMKRFYPSGPPTSWASMTMANSILESYATRQGLSDIAAALGDVAAAIKDSKTRVVLDQKAVDFIEKQVSRIMSAVR